MQALRLIAVMATRRLLCAPPDHNPHKCRGGLHAAVPEKRSSILAEKLRMLAAMRSTCTALFLALQLAGCAGRPQSPADPGPPILISEDMELKPDGAPKSGDPVPESLLEALRTRLLEPSRSELSAPNHLVTSYLWEVFVPRPDATSMTERYNPAYTGDRNQAFRSDADNADFARRVWSVSRSPESLRRNFDAHKA